MTLAAIYARVSNRAKGNSDPWASIPRQIEALQALAVAQGFDVAVVLKEAISGARDDRPQFKRLMGMVERRDVQAVLVVAVDRLTRTEDLGEWESVKRQFQAAGCAVWTVTAGQLPLDGAATSEFVTDAQALVSKFERLRIKERTLAGRVARLKGGGFYGGHTPYGYRAIYDPATGRRSFEVDPEQAAVVQRIADDWLAGLSGRAIAAALDAEGIPWPHGRWRSLNVLYILRNPIYAGIVDWGRGSGHRKNKAPRVTVESGDMPAIWDDATHQRLRFSLAARLNGRSTRGPARVYALAGILRCAACGERMEAASKERGNLGRSSYRCRSVSYERLACGAPSYVNAYEAHRAVLAWLVGYVGELVTPEGLRGRKGAKVRPASEARALARIRARLAELEAERRGLVRLMGIAGGIDDAEAIAELAAIRRQEEEQREALRATEERAALKEESPIAGLLLDAAALLGRVEPDDPILIRLLPSLLASVTLRPTGERRRRVAAYEVETVTLLDGATHP